MENIKYHKTGQFGSAVSTIKKQLTYKGQDAEGKPIYDSPESLKVNMVGTVKLHGTHASIVIYEDCSCSFHSKEQLLGVVDKGSNEYNHISDNAGFSAAMWGRWDNSTRSCVETVLEFVYTWCGKVSYPIKISGEWVGRGVQNGVGISRLKDKAFFMFGVKVGDEWIAISHLELPNNNQFFNIHSFPTYRLNVDLNFPQKASVELEKLTLAVEAECPVTSQLISQGLIEPSEGDNRIGEGIVWVPEDQTLRNNTGTWFKTKGQKHSSSKVKKVASVDPEKIASIEEFIEYAVTENRLNQGLENVKLEMTSLGDYLRWINKDILEEEAHTLEANKLTVKDVGKYISDKARNFFIKKINSSLLED